MTQRKAIVTIGEQWLSIPSVDHYQGIQWSQHQSFKIFFFMYSFLWLCQVLAAACERLVVALVSLAPWSGAELGPPAMGAHNLIHWTTRVVLIAQILRKQISKYSPHPMKTERRWKLRPLQLDWPAPSLSCVIMDKLLKLYGPQFLHL